MSKFQQFQLALANFKRFPLWPVRIIQVSKDKKGIFNYLVFAYGDHTESRLTENSLISFEDNYREASTKTDKNVGSAFKEVNQNPDIYKTASKTFASLRAVSSGPSTADLLVKIVATEEEIAKTKESMMSAITKQVQDKCGNDRTLKTSVETIVSEIYSSVSLEFNPKLEQLLVSVKNIKGLIENLENRIAKLEVKIDDYEQEKQLGTLVFHGIKQQPGVDLKSTILNIASQKLGLSGISDCDFAMVYRSKLNNPGSANDKVAPVFVRFSTCETARKVFASKSKLAGSKIFLSESLTKRRRDILSAARDKFGVKNVWSDRGQVLAMLPGERAARRINSLSDCV